ncbi:MAG: hypothetical protein M1353_02120 [Nitrospirae bacterium]|nr:hypothetical protein [Nitrospirota bacterium]
MKRFLALALIMFVFVASCSKKEVKRTSEDSKIATEAFAVLETVKGAYIKRDINALEKNTTREGFRAISGVMRSFDSAELTFNPVLVEIEDNTVNLNVSWTGKWQKGGKTTEERGMAIFVMTGRPLKVNDILRTSPFKYPE